MQFLVHIVISNKNMYHLLLTAKEHITYPYTIRAIYNLQVAYIAKKLELCVFIEIHLHHALKIPYHVILILYHSSEVFISRYINIQH